MPHAQATPITNSIRLANTKVTCIHRRVIDDVLTEEGDKTGTVRCLECLAIIPDPHLRKARD